MTHDVGEVGSRITSTELKANDPNMMMAISQLIRRNTQTGVLSTTMSTRDVQHKPRAQVSAAPSLQRLPLCFGSPLRCFEIHRLSSSRRPTASCSCAPMTPPTVSRRSGCAPLRAWRGATPRAPTTCTSRSVFLAPLLPPPSLGSRLRSTQGGPHLRRVTDYQNGTVSYSSTDDEASSEMKKEVRRSLWFGSLAVSSMAGMMQWTAAIGAKQGTSKVSSASRPGPPFCPLFRYTDAPTLARWRR